MKQENNNRQGSIVERSNPCAIDAEKAVLGACLVEMDAMSRIVEIVSENSFYLPIHGVLFSVMKELHDNSGIIDLVTVFDKVKENEVFKKDGGIKYLTELTNFVSSAVNIEKHAYILREKETRRNMIRDCFEIIQSAHDETCDLEDVIKDFLKKADDSSGVFNEATDIVNMQDAVKTSLEAFSINQEKLAKGELSGITTGSFEIDKMTGRLQGGNLIIVAARPGMGKTAFALNVAESAAREGSHVVVVSLEMSPRELVNRLIVRDSTGIRSDVLKNLEASPEETREIHRVAGKLQRLPINFVRNNSININKLKTICRKLKKRGKIDLLIVDYLQLMSGSTKGQNREQEISGISRALKTLATELNIPVIALSQLNRALEARQDKTPNMSDLRESGAIEQDADMIMLLNRPAKYDIKEIEVENGRNIPSEGILVCDIAKQRNGSTGDVLLQHNKTVTRIWDYSDNGFGNNDFNENPF